jgi:hypothetical protein
MMINGISSNLYFDMSQYNTNSTSLVNVNSEDKDAVKTVEGNQELSKDKYEEEKDLDKVSKSKENEDLSEEEINLVDKLKARDIEVRQHEMEHMAAGGTYIKGGMSLEYSVGPDGVSYAVGGEVSIDISPEDTPEKTIAKMQQVKSSALAPSQPSGQDMAVAAQASRIQTQAISELSEEIRVKSNAENEDTKDKTTQSSEKSDENSDKISDINARPYKSLDISV